MSSIIRGGGGKEESDPSVLSYEALSTAYEKKILAESAAEEWVSEDEIQRREQRKSLFNAEDAEEDGDSAPNASFSGGQLPRNAVRLQTVTAPAENRYEASPQELVVGLHKALMSCSALNSMAEPDEQSGTISVHVSNALRVDTINQIASFCDHLEDVSQLRLLSTDPHFVHPVVIQKLAVEISASKRQDLTSELLRALGLLMTADQNCSTAIDASVVPLMCTIMQTYKTNPETQALCCRVLSQACNLSVEAVFKEQGNLRMFQALQLHSNVREVAEEALRLFWCIAEAPGAAAALTTNHEQLGVLMVALNKHHDCPRIAESFAGGFWQVKSMHHPHLI